MFVEMGELINPTQFCVSKEVKEMCVGSNRSEDVDSKRCSRGNEIMSDAVKFCAGAVFTLLLPALLFCVVINQLWPLYLMACDEAVGVALGFVMFRRSSGRLLSRVPAPRPRTLHPAQVPLG
jgi:hypothetical protein